VAVSFDLFDTLVAADRSAKPSVAVAGELEALGVTVPEDWTAAYRTDHLESAPSVERSLVDHTRAALASRGVEASAATVRSALLAAFDGPVTVREGASEALEAAADRGPVGVLSNCSLPGLVERTLDRAGLTASLDVVVTSVGCGRRKPHPAAFEAVAAALGIDPAALVHVGDDPRTDGGVRRVGAVPVICSAVPLAEFPAWLEVHG
jgi:HAD superfamily hydrolase (TIGR01509 family)